MTEYKIVSSCDEYKICYDLIKEDYELLYPTVIAVRDGKVIGMISTGKGKENLFAVGMTANSIFTSIGLYELYDQTLRNLGLSHYLFSVEKENKKMINTVEKLFNIKPYTRTGKLLWYVRYVK